MSNLEFEWDPEKAAVNARKHRITFETACGVFADQFAIDELDNCEDYGEDRYTITGMANGRLLFVVYTLRDDIIRIISARGAEPHEQRQYHENKVER
jgi:uncharacterized protein